MGLESPALCFNLFDEGAASNDLFLHQKGLTRRSGLANLNRAGNPIS